MELQCNLLIHVSCIGLLAPLPVSLPCSLTVPFGITSQTNYLRLYSMPRFASGGTSVKMGRGMEPHLSAYCGLGIVPGCSHPHVF